MEMIVQIIGACEVEAGVVKLTCIPYTSEAVREKKKSLISMASSGFNVADMVKEVQGHQQKKHVFFVDRDVWRSEFKNRLYSTIKVNMVFDKFIPDERDEK